jgi:hypothetical protein
MGETRNSYKIVVEKSEGKGSIGRPRWRWENNIIMDLKEIAFESMELINPAQKRDQLWAVLNTTSMVSFWGGKFPDWLIGS